YDAQGNLLTTVGNPLCPGGACDVQTTLIYQEKAGIFFNPYQGFAGINMKQNTAVSTYNALQATLRHTSKDLTLQAAYTWSHALDDSTSTYEQGFSGVNDYQLSRFKATSDINRTHILE